MPPIDLNDHDVFLLRQKIKLVINQYEFSLPTQDGSVGETICFVEQKRFKFKEDIRFFADATKSEEIVRIKARQRFDPRARYDITDPAGVKIGEIQKVFGKSLYRSTFTLFDSGGQETATAQERSLPIALLRRLIGFLPYVGNYADWLPIPYDFDFHRGEKLLATNERVRWKLRDTYTIDLTPDAERTLDRRLVLAAAVGMDALQAR